MQVLYAREQTTEDGARALFLAGPSPRGNGEYDWRKEACRHLEQTGFGGTVYCPLPRDGRYHADYDYDDQIAWELAHLEKAAAIVFWIPRDLAALPGFTTNVEFGRFSRRPGVVLGYPALAPRMRYLHYIARLDGLPVFHTLEETLAAAIDMLTQ